MNVIDDVKRVIDFIEENLTEHLKIENVAKVGRTSTYHFQRVFSLACGVTLGEYIRKRRLSEAGKDLKTLKTTVLSVAIKYGYESQEGFSRAFKTYHGVSPSKARGDVKLNYFNKISFDCKINPSIRPNYAIKDEGELLLVGYKKRFKGSPNGVERNEQEREFMTTTRAKQWLLLGASSNYSRDYFVINNVDDFGYDFYVAYEFDEPTINDLFNSNVTGVKFIESLGFEVLKIPKERYAIFRTEKKKYPINDYQKIRNLITYEEFLNLGYRIKNAPEIVVLNWRPEGERAKERYVEIRLPIE